MPIRLRTRPCGMIKFSSFGLLTSQARSRLSPPGAQITRSAEQLCTGSCRPSGHPLVELVREHPNECGARPWTQRRDLDCIAQKSCSRSKKQSVVTSAIQRCCRTEWKSKHKVWWNHQQDWTRMLSDGLVSLRQPLQFTGNPQQKTLDEKVGAEASPERFARWSFAPDPHQISHGAPLCRVSVGASSGLGKVKSQRPFQIQRDLVFPKQGFRW